MLTSQQVLKMNEEELKSLSLEQWKRYLERELFVEFTMFQKVDFETQKIFIRAIPEKKLRNAIVFSNPVTLCAWIDFLKKLIDFQSTLGQEEKSELLAKIQNVLTYEKVRIKLSNQWDSKQLDEMFYVWEKESQSPSYPQKTEFLFGELKLQRDWEQKQNRKDIWFEWQDEEFFAFYNNSSKSQRIEILEVIFEEKSLQLIDLYLQDKAKNVLEEREGEGILTKTEELYLAYAKKIAI